MLNLENIIFKALSEKKYSAVIKYEKINFFDQMYTMFGLKLDNITLSTGDKYKYFMISRLEQRGFISESEKLLYYAYSMGICYINYIYLDMIPFDYITEEIDKILIVKYNIIPIFSYKDSVIYLGVMNPLNKLFQMEIKQKLKMEVKICMISNQVFDRAKRILRKQDAAFKGFNEKKERYNQDVSFLKVNSLKIIDEGLQYRKNLNGIQVVKFVNVILQKAIESGVSDIHIEPYVKFWQVRYRRDGKLKTVHTMWSDMLPSVASRLKAMAGLNTAREMLPQDGKFSLTYKTISCDVRISVIVTIFGERIVLRLLRKSKDFLDITKMGVDGLNLIQIKKLLKMSNGIILVTGPTGSGKSSTLYACLSSLRKKNLNILTVEDPVEYDIKGVSQVQVNQKIGFNFAQALKSFLRQDPDVIMIGEIRDRETAEIAMQASLTGHLVFSTLHTIDAASAITRLMDMNVDRHLLVSSVVGIIAQRLLRKLCIYCSYAKVPEAYMVLVFEKFGLYTDRVKVASKCLRCEKRGYNGRLGIYEIMVVNKVIQKHIRIGSPPSKIKNIAIETAQMCSLEKSALSEVIKGTIDYKEYQSLY